MCHLLLPKQVPHRHDRYSRPMGLAGASSPMAKASSSAWDQYRLLDPRIRSEGWGLRLETQNLKRLKFENRPLVSARDRSNRVSGSFGFRLSGSRPIKSCSRACCAPWAFYRSLEGPSRAALCQADEHCGKHRQGAKCALPTVCRRCR